MVMHTEVFFIISLGFFSPNTKLKHSQNIDWTTTNYNKFNYITAYENTSSFYNH